MNRDRYPELFQFFGAYFHEDWDVEAATPDGVIDLFNRTHTRDQRAHVADLIDAFERETDDDQALSRILWKDFGCYYTPEADAISVRDWLRHVSRRLREMN